MGCLEWKQRGALESGFSSCPVSPPHLQPQHPAPLPPQLHLCPLQFSTPQSHRPSPATRCLCLPPSLMDPSYSSPGEGVRAPSFSSYLYFLFCPTLIYRETYPR